MNILETLNASFATTKLDSTSTQTWFWFNLLRRERWGESLRQFGIASVGLHAGKSIDIPLPTTHFIFFPRSSKARGHK